MSKLIAKHRKVAAAVISVSTAILLAGSAFVPVASAALTEAQIQSILSLLQSFGSDQTTINNVSASLRGQPTSGAAPAAGACGFTKDLTVGSKSDDVKCLQNYLKGAGHFTGDATGYFGSITKGAVSAWQAANGVTPAAGYFGSVSRAKYGAAPVATTPTTGGTTPVSTPVGSGLTVSAGVQPSGSLFPDNSTRVPFTVMNLTASSDGDVTVDSVTIERTGLANDAAFSGIVLLDDQGTQIGIVKTLNSEHKVTLSEDFKVLAGQTKTVVIAGNSKTSGSGYGGQVAYLSV
ncbi:MAG: peptidoglycan-binding domain-containing protein, partial [Patescibacteria group bacterium]